MKMTRFLLVAVALVSMASVDAAPCLVWTPTTPGAVTRTQCLNVSMPLDHLTPANTATTSVNIISYLTQTPVTTGMWVDVILSAGCQLSNARFQQQWGNYSNRANIAVIFVEPRGSGYGNKVMCPDDPTGKHTVPSKACAEWATTQKVDKYYTMQQMAYDLQLGILPAIGALQPFVGTNFQIRLVAADLFGNAWIQNWQKYFPLNNAASGTVSFIMFNSPPALEQYDFFRNMVENPDSNVRTVLAQCAAIPNCAAKFGGSDLNQLLSEVMRSARQDKLACNAALSGAWDATVMGGPAPTPIFRFYSELLNMLLASPEDIFADWNEQLPSLIPGVLYRIQRCSTSDQAVLTGLYTALKAQATATNTPNQRGALDYARCYVSPVVRWNLVFNDLLTAAPPSTATLLGSENDENVLPTPAYVTSVKTLYDSWPKNPSFPPSKTGYASTGNIPFFMTVGAVNPLVKPQMTIFASGADYAMAPPAVTPVPTYGLAQRFPPVIFPTGNQYTLYTVAEYNDGFLYSCPISYLLNFAANQTQPYCATHYGAVNQFDFIGANAKSAAMRTTFLAGAGATHDPFQFTVVAGLPETYPPKQVGFDTPTPLPPGETPDPPTTPLPPGATYAPTTPTPDVVSGSGINFHEHEDIRVHISVGGLVGLIIAIVIILVVVAVCVGKCVQKRMNDPTKRDFYQEVYGGNAPINAQPQQENIYKQV